MLFVCPQRDKGAIVHFSENDRQTTAFATFPGWLNSVPMLQNDVHGYKTTMHVPPCRRKAATRRVRSDMAVRHGQPF